MNRTPSSRELFPRGPGSPTGSHISLGRAGESEAALFLKKNGFDIVEQNVRFKSGEIDLIAESKDTILFVEVKTGIAQEGFRPLDRFNEKKKMKLLRLAKIYLTKNPTQKNVRFDFIEVTRQKNRFNIEHFKNVIEDIAE